MPRPAGIWWNSGKKKYYATIAGHKTPLDADEEKAQEMYERLKRKEKAPDFQDNNTCRTIFYLYLDYVEKESPASYRISKYSLSSFIDHHKELMVKDLRAVHVQEWLNGHPGWGDSMQNTVVGWLVAALNWAAKPENRYITRNPIAGISRPAGKSRGEEAVIDPADHKTLTDGSNERLRDIVFCLQQTGMRPGMACTITAADCDFGNRVITLARHKTVKKTGTPIKIPMTEPLAEMLQRLCREHPQGPIFLTRRGRPYTSNYLSEHVGRTRKRLGIEARLTPYGYRHTTATTLLQAGVDDAKVAQILGHTTTAMLYRHYGHLSKFMRPLAEAMDAALNGPVGVQEESKEEPEGGTAGMKALTKLVEAAGGAEGFAKLLEAVGGVDGLAKIAHALSAGAFKSEPCEGQEAAEACAGPA
jgi:integrase